MKCFAKIPKRVSSFWNNNYIEYESNGDKNNNLSLDKEENKQMLLQMKAKNQRL